MFSHHPYFGVNTKSNILGRVAIYSMTFDNPRHWETVGEGGGMEIQVTGMSCSRFSSN